MVTNYLTIDVEDYFQVSAFEKTVGGHINWGKYSSRVVDNTKRVLELLNEKETKATFFVLGWVAEKYPQLVKEISNDHHEIGCHSYYHRLVYELTPDEFREDTRRTKELLEDIIGKQVLGYRAPSYSITQKSLWALSILKNLGFEYDSSIFPIIHDRYGIPDAPRFPFKWDLTDTQPRCGKPTFLSEGGTATRLSASSTLVEFPISTTRLWGRNIPSSGGGYFRLFPYWLTKYLLKKINTNEYKPFVFYLHPWEIDSEQPRFNNASALSKFRHYNNLTKTKERLVTLLKDFKFQPIPLNFESL